MARKPTTIPEAVETTPIDVAAMAEIQNTGARLEQAFGEEQRNKHAAVHQRIGRRQALGFVGKLVTVTNLIDLQKMKDAKEYKGLEIISDGKLVTITTFDDYCRIVEGRSRESVDLDLANLNALGESLYEAMNEMGIGPSKMRSLRKLPEDEKAALIEVAQTGDKDSFVELAEEFIAKSARDKEALQRERDEARADYDAQSELLSKKNAELDSTRFELERTRRRIQDQTPDEAMAQLKIEANGVLVELESVIVTKLDTALETLLDHAHEAGVDATDNRLYMANLIAHVERKLLALRDKYELPDDLSTAELDWHTPEAQAAALAAVEAAKAGRG